MNKKWFAGIAIYLGLIAVCLIALYAVPSLKGALERTYIAEYGSIDVKDEVSAFIVRDETVYVASRPSYINRLAETDKLVKAKTGVVELTPDEAAIKADEEAAARAEEIKSEYNISQEQSEDSDGEDATAKDTAKDASNTGKYRSIMEELGDNVKKTKSGKSKTAGYVSYYVDGAEAKLSTEALNSLTYSDFKELTGRKAIEVPDSQCDTGYPVFKIVKNRKWYLVFYVDKDSAAKYETGDAVTIDINGDPVNVTVSQVTEEKSNTRITLSCKSFFDGFLEVRNLDTTVTLKNAEGLVLEDNSIVEDPDGRRGVFVVNKLGEHVFVPIKVKADDGIKCVVFSDIYVDENSMYVETIGTYDEIVANPSNEDLASIGIEVTTEDTDN